MAVEFEALGRQGMIDRQSELARAAAERRCHLQRDRGRPVATPALVARSVPPWCWRRENGVPSMRRWFSGSRSSTRFSATSTAPSDYSGPAVSSRPRSSSATRAFLRPCVGLGAPDHLRLFLAAGWMSSATLMVVSGQSAGSDRGPFRPGLRPGEPDHSVSGAAHPPPPSPGSKGWPPSPAASGPASHRRLPKGWTIPGWSSSPPDR